MGKRQRNRERNPLWIASAANVDDIELRPGGSDPKPYSMRTTRKKTKAFKVPPTKSFRLPTNHKLPTLLDALHEVRD